MMSSIGTLMMEAYATGCHKRTELRKAQPFDGDEESDHDQQGVHAGHVHGSSFYHSIIHSRYGTWAMVTEKKEQNKDSFLKRLFVGASERASTIKPLVAALSFHQFFEGTGLGGCISQAKFNYTAISIMVRFFSLTTVGIGISKIYDQSSPTALIVQGLLNSASAGILTYVWIFLRLTL
ncbi:hypothetical protein CUMW_116300 [Citrus unshiu]|nr:hypothetical protein CUMW_116300 [Citrus unshiu]